jgi:hypothetical protein
MSTETIQTPITESERQNMAEFFHQVRDRAKGMHASCLERAQPDVAAKVLWLLAQGASKQKIRQLTGVSCEVIRRLEWDHEDTLESKRKEFSSRYAMAAAEYTDLLFKKAEQLHDDPEQLAAVSPERLATVIGIMNDKAMTLNGMATSIVEHKKGASIEDAAKVIEEVRKRIADNARNKAVEAEVVETF